MAKKTKSTQGPTVFPGRVPANKVTPNPEGNREERRAAAKEDKKKN
ncbi:hypothetical protein AB0E08_03730 [Streptomyces sp. NPDC048281]